MKTILSFFCFCFLCFSSIGQCFLDRHNTSTDQAWITCNNAPNPNTQRGFSQWIMYDFSEPQHLGKTHFWNINAVDKTSMGIKEAMIDYSWDGITWNEWGTFQLNQATGSGFYEGEEGPDLTGTNARFILITVFDNYGNICSGLSEVKIETLGVVTSSEDVVTEIDQLRAQPNPASNFSDIIITVAAQQNITLNLVDLSGKILFEKNYHLSAGEQKIRLDVSSYPEGQYVVNIDNGKHTQFVNISIVNP